MDLYQFVASRGSARGLQLRILYVLLSSTGKPVLPIILGSFLAGHFSRRYPTTQLTQSGSPFAGEDFATSTAVEAEGDSAA